MTNKEYKFFRENFKIHTLSDVEDFEDKNIFIYTPERYLSFIDKNDNFNIDFVFVDEIYKIDNEYLTNDEKKKMKEIRHIELHYITYFHYKEMHS